MTVAFGERDLDDLLSLAHGALARATGAGADTAEVYLWEARSQEVLGSKRTRTAEESDRSGVSVRAALNGRMAFATTSGLRGEDLEWVVGRAVRSAGLVPPSDRPAELPHPGRPVDPAPVDPVLEGLDVTRLMDLGNQVEDAVAAGRGSNHFNYRIGTHVGRFVVVNTNGVEAWDRHAHEGLQLEVRARKDRTHKIALARAFDRQPLEAAHDLEGLAADARQRAEDATRPGSLDGFVDRVVLDGLSAAHLLDKLVPSFLGRPAHQGRSNFSGKLGEAVASEQLTIMDRPHGPGGCRHQRVDDEGVPTRQLTLIEDGVLRNYLYNWEVAREFGEEPTGHGLRPITSRYGTPPNPRAANLQVRPGDWTLAEMVEDLDRGVLVRDAFLGSFTMDRLAGDFSFVAPLAYYVEGGEVQHPLVSTAVSGNLFDAIASIRGLGREVARYPLGEFVPVSLEGLTCAT